MSQSVVHFLRLRTQKPETSRVTKRQLHGSSLVSTVEMEKEMVQVRRPASSGVKTS
jgi:hypothetical protein